MKVCCASNIHEHDTSRAWRNWAHPNSPIHRSMVESRDGWCLSRSGGMLSDSVELGWERSGVESAIFGTMIYTKAKRVQAFIDVVGFYDRLIQEKKNK